MHLNTLRMIFTCLTGFLLVKFFSLAHLKYNITQIDPFAGKGVKTPIIHGIQKFRPTSWDHKVMGQSRNTQHQVHLWLIFST